MKLLWSMRMKTFAAVVIIDILVILAIAAFFQYRTAQFFTEEYADALYDRTYSASKVIDERFQDVYRLSRDAAFDKELLRLAASDRQEERSQLAALLRQYKSRNPLIDNVYCYFPERQTLVKSAEYKAVQPGNSDTAAWFTMTLTQQGLVPLTANDRIAASGKGVYLYAVPLKAGDVSAVLVFTVSERGLYYTYLDNFSRTDGRQAFLLDNSHRIVSGSQSLDSQTSGQMLSEIKGPVSGKGSLRLDGQTYMTAWLTMPFSDYTLVILDNQERLQQKLQMMQLASIMSALVVLTISVLFLYLTAIKLNQPVEELADAMKRVGHGNLDQRAKVDGSDEIAYLATRFNRMLDHIGELVDRLATEKNLKREAELKSLQYQIRPHFIYNTLNSIRLAALMQGAKSLADVLGSFIEILRVSTGRKGGFATLGDEIRTIRDYVALQEFRHRDSFDVKYDLAPDSLDCCVPRLLLQPLVENSILHGPSSERPFCHILIRSHLEEDSLVLEVRDDGCGLSEADLLRLNVVTAVSSTAQQLSRGGMSNVGITNIRERLRLYYGARGMLHYDSDGHSFTSAVVHLPVSRDIHEYELEMKGGSPL